jgi:EmrB/QacA subfamily drug resistance transporter
MQAINKNRPVAITIILLIGAVVGLLNQTLLNTALLHIIQEFHLTTNTAQWLTTGFMLANGITIPVTAVLMARFTTRELFFYSMGLFLIGTIISASAPGFYILLTGRIVQAVGAAIIFVLGQTVILSIFPMEKRGTVMGVIGIAVGLGPGLGPVLSGWIIQSYSWRLLFIGLIPIIILDMLIAIFVLPNVGETKKSEIDWLSILFSSVGFGGLLYGFSRVGSHGWSSGDVITSLSIGMIALVLFISRQFQLKNPVLEFRVFRSKVFAFTTVISMIVMIAMLGAELILPIYMQDMRGFSPLMSGLALLPGAIAAAIMSPIAGKLFDKFGARWITTTGLSILVITTFMFVHLSTTTSFSWIAAVYAIRKLVISLVLMPVLVTGINHLPQKLIAHGTAMNNTMRQVAAAIGTAILVTVMTYFAGETKNVTQAIYGVHIAFLIVACAACFALLLAVLMYVKPAPVPMENRS